MYLSPKSSSSSICLLRDWARSHLYSLPGLTICNPSNKLWSFLDRLCTSNTLLYSKQDQPDRCRLCKNHQLQDFGKQREQSLRSLKFQLQHSLTNQPNPQQNFNNHAFQTQNSKDVRNASIIRSLHSQNIKKHLKTLFGHKIQRAYATRP